MVANTATDVEIPEMINLAILLNADALPCYCIKCFPFVYAMLQFVSAGAVFIAVSYGSPDELSEWAHDQFLSIRVDTWLKYTWRSCYKMLNSCLS